MGQGLTNGFDVVAVVNEIELQRAIRHRFLEGLGRFGLPAELDIAIPDGTLGVSGARLACRIGLPASQLSPSRDTIAAERLDQPETHSDSIEVRVPFADSALLAAAGGVGGLNFELSLIFRIARVTTESGDESLGVDTGSLVVWLSAREDDADPDAADRTTRAKLDLLMPPGLNRFSWVILEASLAGVLQDQPFVAALASGLPGLRGGACAVTEAAPQSLASFDIPARIQCFDFQILSPTLGRFALAITAMLTGTSVSSAVGDPTSPLPVSWAQATDRAVAIVSDDFLLNEALPRSLMAAILDPLLTAAEEDVRDEVEDDEEVEFSDREGEIDRRFAEVRQQTAEEHFRLRPFVMLRAVSRNFHLPLKSEADENRDDASIDAAFISSIPDPAVPGRRAFRVTLHATGGVPGVYSVDATVSVRIRFSASGGRVEPEIEPEDSARVTVHFENVVSAAAGVIALITGAFTLGIGAIATFVGYHMLELVAGGIASALVPGAIEESLDTDVAADLPAALPLVVRAVEQDDLLLRGELGLADDLSIQWLGLTPAATGFRLDLDHGSPSAAAPDIQRRFDAFTGVTAANADVDLVEGLVRARNGAQLFDFGAQSLGRAVNVVQADIRGRGEAGIANVELDDLADATEVRTFDLDRIAGQRTLLVRILGVVTNEGTVARLIFVSDGGLTRCFYTRYRQTKAGVQLSLTLRVDDERRSGVLRDEITVFVTIPTDIGRGIDIGGLARPAGVVDRPTEFVIQVGSEVRELAHAGTIGLSTTLLLQPLRSIVWSVTNRNGTDRILDTGAPVDVAVPTNAVVTFTVHDDRRGVDFVSRLGDTGDFLVNVTVADYRGTSATDVSRVPFQGSRFLTHGFDRVRDLMDLDGRLRQEGPIPEGPDPSPQGRLPDDGRPTKASGGPKGRPERRELARHATTAAVGRKEFDVSDPRAPLLAHLARLNRRAAGTRSEAAIERAVDEWTRAILVLPDAQALVERHRKRGDGRNVSRAAAARASAPDDGELERDDA